MKYWIVGVILLVGIALIIAFVPGSKYLGVYEDKMTIELETLNDDYNWSYSLDNNIIKVDSEGLLNNNDHKVENDKAIIYWRWKSVSDGTAKLIYRYSNGNNTMYTITYDLKVKNKKIYWVYGKATGLTDYPNPY